MHVRCLIKGVARVSESGAWGVDSLQELQVVFSAAPMHWNSQISTLNLENLWPITLDPLLPDPTPQTLGPIRSILYCNYVSYLYTRTSHILDTSSMLYAIFVYVCLAHIYETWSRAIHQGRTQELKGRIFTGIFKKWQAAWLFAYSGL